MLCPQCQSEVPNHFKYCPACGAKLSFEDQISSQPPAEVIVAKKPMPLWFKIASFLAVLALIGVTAGILFTESLVDVVDNQLRALREQDISKAYHAYTSLEFQQSTSFEQFRNFVKAYPFFLNNQSASFTQRSIKNNVGTLKGKLTTTDHLTIPVEYQLIKEDGKWKILNISILESDKERLKTQFSDAQDLVQLIKNQLQDIQNHDVSKAYQEYSSQDFKNTTSEEDFQSFIKKYPIIETHQNIHFQPPTFKDGLRSIAVTLQSDGINAYLHYYFIYEDDKWKIWSMHILSPSTSERIEENSK